MSIYEVHLGSWRRKGNNEWLSYRELAEQLAALCPRSRLYPCRIPARQRASVRRLLGLPADRDVCADQPVRHAGGFFRAGRCLPSRGPRRAAGLGARAFPRRSARPRQFRRHRALRARQPAAGPPSRLGHADLQLRPHRSGQFPGLERAVLAGALRHRRPARRCGGLDAVSRLQPARRAAGSRTNMAAAKISKRSISCAASIPRCSRDFRRPPPRRKNQPHGRRCRARSNMAGSASATNGTWAGCTTR